MIRGTELIAEERQRQIAVKGFTAANDKDYTDKQLAKAALAYVIAYIGSKFMSENYVLTKVMEWWPWPSHWFRLNEKNPRRMLAKAGALIAAELDRTNTE